MNFDCNGYLANGLKVFIKDCPIVNPDNAVAEMLAFTSKLLADGLTLDMPGMSSLEPGEKREMINGILRRNYMDDDGTIVPVIDIYPDNPVLGRRCVFIYLDTQTQIDEFEAVTGITLSKMPVYTESQLNRVEKPKVAEQFIIPVKGSVAVIFKDNPAYDPNAAKKKAKHLFIRWDVATPPPQPATAPAAVGMPSASEPVVGDDWEANERRKAVTALNNELITITKARYTPTSNGLGVPSWTATATVSGGGTVPVIVFGEDVHKIVGEGYEWSKTDGDKLAIPVITEMRGSDRRITYVEPLERQPDAITEQPSNPAWYATPVKDCFGAVKQLVINTEYHNNPHEMKASFLKHGVTSDKDALKLTPTWATRPAGALIEFLKTRHETPLPLASGQ